VPAEAAPSGIEVLPAAAEPAAPSAKPVAALKCGEPAVTKAQGPNTSASPTRADKHSRSSAATHQKASATGCRLSVSHGVLALKGSDVDAVAHLFLPSVPETAVQAR
jgi:hypothetical protein